MKKELQTLKSKCIALSVAAGLAFTGCETNTDGIYNSKDYAIVYVDGNPYFVQGYVGLITFMTREGKASFYDVGTDKKVGTFSTSFEIDENATFSNDIGSNVTRFSIIPLVDIIDNDTFTKETYQFFANGSEKVDQYIEENYLYDVTFYQEYKDDTYETELGIYEFTDEISGEKTYHVGYNANRLYESDSIFDIKEGKVYRKPDVGFYTFIPISDLYDDYTITVEQATEVMNNYISQKESKSSTSNVESDLLDENQSTPEPTKISINSPIIADTEKSTKKERTYNHTEFSIINAKLIDSSIDQKYYLVREKKSSSHTKCPYSSAKNAKMVCYSDTFTSVDEKHPATFVQEVHYSDYLKGNSYLCMKANIDGKKYKKVYKLDPGTIDHNPSNLKKVKKFEGTTFDLNEVLSTNDIDSKDSYSDFDIRKLNKQISKRKVLKK